MLCKYETLIISLDNFERLLQLKNSISVYDFSQGFCLPSSWCGQRHTEAGRQFLWVQVMAFISAQSPLSSQLINKKQIHQINLYESQHHYGTKEYNGHKAGSQKERGALSPWQQSVEASTALGEEGTDRSSRLDHSSCRMERLRAGVVPKALSPTPERSPPYPQAGSRLCQHSTEHKPLTRSSSFCLCL